MALTKKVNGIDVPMTEQEEAEIRSFWAENDKKKILEDERNTRYFFLQTKYKDPYEAIDKICRHLKIDFETLED